ncbi:MAG: putative Fe-S cluster assembly protein SufT [Xanthomonadales bacterium]|nr:putative Fe-S cluster assembly protein SufT [Xanthomonadales bacterium]
MRSHENEPFILSRDTPAVMVPSGDVIELKVGLSGFITQALGGSFTLYIEGNLYRLSGEHADAIGKQAAVPPELPPGATEDDVRDLAWKQMRRCYECVVTPAADGNRELAVKMTLTAPGCGMGEVLVQDVKEKLEVIPTVTKADVELVFDPPWNQSMMSEAARLQTGMM